MRTTVPMEAVGTIIVGGQEAKSKMLLRSQGESNGFHEEFYTAAPNTSACQSHFRTHHLIAAFCGLLSATFFAGCGGIPSQVHDTIFVKSAFAQPIGIDPGPEDGAAAIAYARQHTTDNGLLSRVVITSYLQADKTLLSFLVKQGVSEVECIPVTHRYGTDTYCYIAHTPAQEQLRRVAARQLTKITYSNRYKTSILGTETTVHAVTFQYKIDVFLKDFPPPKETFEGSAQAVLNPNTGNWELMDIKLSDKGSSYFVDYIHSQYKSYAPPATATAKAAAAGPSGVMKSRQEASASTPDWVPRCPGARLVDEAPVSGLIWLKCGGSVDEVVAFYEREAKKAGMRVQKSTLPSGAKGVLSESSASKRRVWATVESSDEGTKATVRYEKISSTPAWVPRCPGAQVSSEAPETGLIFLKCSGSVDEVVAFYEREIKKAGKAIQRSTLPSGAIEVNCEQTSKPYFGATVSSGDKGTEVTVNYRR